MVFEDERAWCERESGHAALDAGASRCLSAACVQSPAVQVRGQSEREVHTSNSKSDLGCPGTSAQHCAGRCLRVGPRCGLRVLDETTTRVFLF